MTIKITDINNDARLSIPDGKLFDADIINIRTGTINTGFCY